MFQRLTPVLLLLVAMWLATAVNWLLLKGAWLVFGIRARDLTGLVPNLLFAPFLHAGLAHLVANSAPFVVLGALIALRSPAQFVAVNLIGAILGGLVVWLLAPANSVTIGASGLVFAYFGWLITRAIRERSILSIVIGLVALALYGGILWGLSPFQVGGISWQGHLGGLLSGVIAGRAWPTRKAAPLQTYHAQTRTPHERF